LQTEEGGFQGITDELQRIRELQISAGNDALSAQDQQAVQDEIDQRVNNIAGIVENTQFAGTPLIEAGTELAGIIENGVEADGELANVDAALEEVSSERSELGVEVNAIQSRINQRQNTFENTVSSFSRINDLDFATAVAKQVNLQIRQELSIRSLNSLFAFNRQNATGLLNAL
jgi:flagellin